MTSGPVSPCLQLPLLAAGQAHKDLTHNEALLLVDALLTRLVQGLSNDPPPAPARGDMWVIGSLPTGLWAGMAHSLALWTSGGWRLIVVPAGYRVRAMPDGTILRRTTVGWATAPGAVAPTGGTVVDIECRASVMMLHAAMVTAGLIAA